MDKATLERLERLYDEYSVMPNFVSQNVPHTLEGLNIYQRTVTSSNFQEYGKIPFWKVLLLDLITRIDIWQRDENGNIKYTDKCYPKIAIMKLMFNIGKVISYLLVLIAKSQVANRLQ